MSRRPPFLLLAVAVLAAAASFVRAPGYNAELRLHLKNRDRIAGAIRAPEAIHFGESATGEVAAGPAGPVSFANYPAPLDIFFWGSVALEPTIGVNPRTNAAMFMMTGDQARVEFDDATLLDGFAKATWTNVTYAPGFANTFDPILYTDPATGRTFVAQLEGPGSLVAYTDDDGATWTTAEPASVAPSFDHQSVGAGPYAEPLPPTAALNAYGRAVYYCAQLNGYMSQCARSDDGGFTWGAPLPMNVRTCLAVHGHIAVDPDGVVYVPHGSCFIPNSLDRSQGVFVSRDNGASWTFHTVPGVLGRNFQGDGFGDPAIAVDASGRLYFTGVDRFRTDGIREGRAFVSTSEDDGVTWSAPVDVGATFGVRNAEFSMAAAGSDGRAAVAFYGTTTPGDTQAATFDGAWHLYVAITTDAGATWTTARATADPVQRGCIWMRGGVNACRNLADFMGMTLDADGRVLVGYSDGCTSVACVRPSGTPSDGRSSRGTIARQVSGPRLVAP